MKKYRFSVDVTKAIGVQCGYVYASSLAEAKRKYEQCDVVTELEELEVLEIGDDVTWIDEE